MTREDLIATIEDATRQGRWDELIATLRAADGVEVFETLFPMAAASQLAGPAYSAACLLFLVQPPCPLPCREAIRALLSDWDVSIEEVPCYLAARFGEDAMLQAVAELEAEPLTSQERVRLGTVRYWIDHYFNGELAEWLEIAQERFFAPTARGDEPTPAGDG